MRLKLRMWRRVVSIAALAILVLPMAATAETSKGTFVSRMTDSRIDESSSLAVSPLNSDFAYTANDENGPVYVVQVSTGELVGAASLTVPIYGTQTVQIWVCRKSAKLCNPSITCAKAKARAKKCKRVTRLVPVVTGYKTAALIDPEAMATDSAGRLWLADLGDNNLVRSDAALYAMDEPGIGTRTVVATRYPIAYPNGERFNVETLLINPATNAKYLVSKTLDGSPARLFQVPATLSTTTPNVVTEVNRTMPPMISDGDFSPGGTRVILRDGTPGSTLAHVYNPATWTKLGTFQLPWLDGKPEAVSFDDITRSRFLISREGDDSPLFWVPFNEATWTPTSQ